MDGMFWLFIIGLFFYIYIFDYLYVDSLTYAFGWSAFLCRIRFCDALAIIFYLVKLQHYKLAMSYAKQTNNSGYNYGLLK
jgi:hypothetical protein